jgi:hypothetical protein
LFSRSACPPRVRVCRFLARGIGAQRDSNAAREIAIKLAECFQSGTRLAWVIHNRSGTVAVYHAPGKPTAVRDEQETLDGEQVMPGL